MLVLSQISWLYCKNLYYVFFFSLCLSVMSNRGGILLCSVPLLFENIFTHMLFFFLGLLDIERTCKKDEKAGKYAEQGENSFRVDLCWRWHRQALQAWGHARVRWHAEKYTLKTILHRAENKPLFGQGAHKKDKRENWLILVVERLNQQSRRKCH